MKIVQRWAALFAVLFSLPTIGIAQTPAPSSTAVNAAAQEDAKMTLLARATYNALSAGTLDRTLLSATLSAHLTPALLAKSAAQLGPLGPPKSFVFVGKIAKPAVTLYGYAITYDTYQLTLTMGIDSAGKIAVLAVTG